MDNAQEENYADGCSVMSGSITRSAMPYLHTLPTELWFACWTLCSRRQLRRISLVCKRFRDICISLIFQQQTVEARGERLHKGNWIEHLHRLHRAAVRLDALAGSAHVASVHSWKFVAGKFTPAERPDIPHLGLVHTTYARLLKTFSTTLYLYHNLRSLYLEAVIIDAPFRQIFAELSRLDILALHSCDIVERDGFIVKLRSFTISAPEATAHRSKVPREPLRIVAPDSLHTLHLDAADETAPLLAAFGSAQFPQLVVLSLQHLSDLDMFLAFLAQCSGLEALKITSVDPDVIESLPQYALSPDTIPDLRDLTIRGEMLGFFTSKRPITAITVLNEPSAGQRHPSDFTPTVLNDLLNTSVPLLSLSIPETSPTLELLTYITLLFPRIQQLSIHLTRFTVTAERLIRCGGRGRSRRSQPISVDKRCPVLHDAEAFDNIPEDDLSDAEQDKLPPIALVRVPKELQISSSPNYQNILHWTCSGAASLPQGIEILRFISTFILTCGNCK
ncbi:hypothetical protein MSAN_00306800 [Mycena sanguinolenta]|uniref:F-box domain-containing protein n=1 Tax=Mycena sanguinolenta TaxID=230812 RepID=A0A8H6ZBK0_9AGAR|nr:hypothetical protein MSAN_00306800 [Mycena sanguinolenta]